MQVLRRRWQCNEDGGKRIATEIVKVSVGQFLTPKNIRQQMSTEARLHWSKQPWLEWLLERKIGEVAVEEFEEAVTMMVNMAIIVEITAEDATYMTLKWDV